MNSEFTSKKGIKRITKAARRAAGLVEKKSVVQTMVDLFRQWMIRKER